MAELYKLEKQIRNSPPAKRLEVRQKKSVRCLVNLKKLLDTLNEQTLPRHPLKKALEYALNQ